jgi:hypothetical protein
MATALSRRSPSQVALRAALGAGDDLHIDADTARPTDVTARMDLGYVVSVALDGVQRARQPFAAQYEAHAGLGPGGRTGRIAGSVAACSR